MGYDRNYPYDKRFDDAIFEPEPIPNNFYPTRELTKEEVNRWAKTPHDADAKRQGFIDHIRKHAGESAAEFAANSLAPFPEPAKGSEIELRRINNMTMPNRIMKPQEMDRMIQRMGEMMLSVVRSQELAARFPSQPPKGTVLRFERKFSTSDKPVFYVAYRLPSGKWKMIGDTEGESSPTWEDLQTLIGNQPCEMSTEWTEVPSVDQEDYDAIDDPKEWFKRSFMTQGQHQAQGDAPAGNGSVIDAESEKK